MLKETLPHMRAAGKGQVIIVTSLVGFSGFPFTDAYTASKFALEGMPATSSIESCSWRHDAALFMATVRGCQEISHCRFALYGYAVDPLPSRILCDEL